MTRGPSMLDNAISAAANSLLPGSGALAVGAKNLLSNGLGAIRSTIKGIMGSGDYTVGGLAPGPGPGNSLTVNNDAIPRFSSDHRSIRVAHREFIKIVKTSTVGYECQSWGVTPSDQAHFPWLTKMSCLYNKFRIRGLVYEFVSMSSDYAANTSLGTIVMAHSADPRTQSFTAGSRQALEMLEGTISVKPSRSALLAVECDSAYKQMAWLQCGSRAVYQNIYGDAQRSDPLLLEHGRFFLATDLPASATNVPLGELWVSYDVEFFDQRPDDNACEWQCYVKSSNYGTPLRPLGDLSLAAVGQNMGVRIQQPDALTALVSIPYLGKENLYFEVIYTLYGNSANVGSPFISATSNCAILTPFNFADGPNMTSFNIRPDTANFRCLTYATVLLNSNAASNPTISDSVFTINLPADAVPGTPLCGVLSIIAWNGSVARANLVESITII